MRKHYGSLLKMRKELLGIPKSRFCCFVSSHKNSKLFPGERFRILTEVSRLGRVDSAGAVDNNCGYLAPYGNDYFKWIASYKFMICPENSMAEGYVTEKPLQTYISGTIPIYAGGYSKILNKYALIDAMEPNYLDYTDSLLRDEIYYRKVIDEDLYIKRPSLSSFFSEFSKQIASILN